MLPRFMMTPPTATPISATSRPYSTAVAPDSLRMKLRSTVNTAGHSPPVASGAQKTTQAFNDRCSDMVDARRWPGGGRSRKRKSATVFSQRLHESRPRRLALLQEFISNGAKVVGND